MSASLVTIALLLGPLAQFDDGPSDWDEERKKVQLALRHYDRPLTMPHDVFDIFADGGFTQLSSQWVAATADVGARYGVDDNMETGLRLLRLTVSEAPDTGLELPTLFAMYRVGTDVFEAAVRLETELPLRAGQLQIWLQVPMLARLGPFLRADLRPTITTITSAAWQWAAYAPLTVSAQVTDRLRIFGHVEIEAPDLRTAEDLLLRAGGGLAWVFGDPSFEVVLSVTSPSVALAGQQVPDPVPGNYVSGALSVRMFFQGPTESRDDPVF